MLCLLQLLLKFEFSFYYKISMLFRFNNEKYYTSSFNFLFPQKLQRDHWNSPCIFHRHSLPSPLTTRRMVQGLKGWSRKLEFYKKKSHGAWWQYYKSAHRVQWHQRIARLASRWNLSPKFIVVTTTIPSTDRGRVPR